MEYTNLLIGLYYIWFGYNLLSYNTYGYIFRKILLITICISILIANYFVFCTNNPLYFILPFLLYLIDIYLYSNIGKIYKKHKRNKN